MRLAVLTVGLAQRDLMERRAIGGSLNRYGRGDGRRQPSSRQRRCQYGRRWSDGWKPNSGKALWR